jgi:hypothetical protein
MDRWTKIDPEEPYLPKNRDDFILSTYRQLSWRGNPSPGSGLGFVVQHKNQTWHSFIIDHRYVVCANGQYPSKRLAMKATRDKDTKEDEE